MILVALNKHSLELLETLTQLNGISGHETEVRKYLKETYTNLGYETISPPLTGDNFDTGRNPPLSQILACSEDLASDSLQTRTTRKHNTL